MAKRKLMTYTLYLKKHNLTLLKYLGKTIKDDPYKYPGSGKYWKRHLKKHGDDVSTKIIYQSDECDQRFIAYCVGTSIANNIVVSSDYANLQLENGRDGQAGGEEYKQRCRDYWAEHPEKVAQRVESRKKSNRENPEKIKRTNQKISDTLSKPTNPNNGRKNTQKTKDLMSDSAKNRKACEKFGCLKCNRIIGARNIKRHLESCYR